MSERSLDPEEKQKMNEAKQVEIKNFISAKALEAIPAHLQPDKQAAMRMRWILTWKRDDSGGQRAKARCVILGYMDPQYEHRQEASPTMTRTSRQVMLAVSASLGFGVWKGDVSEAFLQGREYKGESFVIPTDDICDAGDTGRVSHSPQEGMLWLGGRNLGMVSHSVGVFDINWF